MGQSKKKVSNKLDGIDSKNVKGKERTNDQVNNKKSKEIAFNTLDSGDRFHFDVFVVKL